MKHTSFFLLVLMPFCVLSFSNVSAQNTGKYSFGINAGVLIYNGDLSPQRTGSWKTPGFVWGLTGLRTITSTLAARLDVNFGKLRGNEALYANPEYRQYRAFAFNSNVTEIAVLAEWTPFVVSKKLSPYAVAGLGYAGLRTVRDYSHFDAAYFSGEPSLIKNLEADIATPLPRGVAIFPVGLGLNYSLTNKLSLHTEAAHRFTRSDYVDAFSRSGNPDLKDSYTKYSVGLRYTPGNKDPYACPTIYY